MRKVRKRSRNALPESDGIDARNRILPREPQTMEEFPRSLAGNDSQHAELVRTMTPFPIRVPRLCIWSWSHKNDGESHGELAHLWFIGKGVIVPDKFSVLGIVSPKGPPKPLHSLWFTWKDPVSGIDAIRFGKHIPNFGYEFRTYRIDQAPVIGFTATSKPLMARANGAEIESHAGKLQVVVGAFTRDRVGGDIPSTDKSWDHYLRLRRPIVGTCSQERASVRPTRMCWVVILSGNRSECSLQGSTSDRSAPSGMPCASSVPPASFGVLDFENLRGGEHRLVFGPTIQIVDHLELKVNGVASNTKPEKLLAQLTVRW